MIKKQSRSLEEGNRGGEGEGGGGELEKRLLFLQTGLKSLSPQSYVRGKGGASTLPLSQRRDPLEPGNIRIDCFHK